MPQTLLHIQERFFDAITVRAPAGKDLVKESRGLAPYRNAYRSRIRDAIETDFGTSLKLLGRPEADGLFDYFFAHCFCTSFTMNTASLTFWKFVQDASPESARHLPAWFVEMIDFEWALITSIFATQPVPQRKQIILSKDPRIGFTVDQGIALRKYKFPVQKIYVDEKLYPEQDSPLAVFSREESGYHQELDPLQFEMLRLLLACKEWAEIESQMLAQFEDATYLSARIRDAMDLFTQEGLIQSLA